MSHGVYTAKVIAQCANKLPGGVHVHMQAVGVIGLSAYLSYLVGDYMGLSGIVALFCCAVAISHYTMKNISRQYRTVVKSVFETLSYLAEGSIFVYVGLDALDPEKWTVRCPA
jgi:NhaP-type Na+/H+ or K+/H+ antiporter